MTCESQDGSDGWELRSTTDQSKPCDGGCVLVDVYPSDSGVYWCESRHGECSNRINITVTGTEPTFRSSGSENRRTSRDPEHHVNSVSGCSSRWHGDPSGPSTSGDSRRRSDAPMFPQGKIFKECHISVSRRVLQRWRVHRRRACRRDDPARRVHVRPGVLPLWTSPKRKVAAELAEHQRWLPVKHCKV